MFIGADVHLIASLLLEQPGSVVAYPTETFYGLGARVNDRKGMDRIIAAKGRDTLKGMIVLAGDLAMAATMAFIDRRRQVLLEKVWPGPVSVLLEARQKLDELLAPGGKVALRVSPNALATELVRLAGPVTSTSANRTGGVPARTAGEVERQGLDVDAILDGGQTPGGKPSTLIDLTVWPPACLRQGVVPFDEIRALIP